MTNSQPGWRARTMAHVMLAEEIAAHYGRSVEAVLAFADEMYGQTHAPTYGDALDAAVDELTGTPTYRGIRRRP